MKEDKIRKWEILLSQVKLECGFFPLQISTEKALRTFELAFPFSLPEDYKLFAQRMGCGTFGDSWISIDTPYELDVLEGVKSDKAQIDIYKDQFEEFPEIVSILDRSWCFAGRGQMFFTLSKKLLSVGDSSYEIYAIDDDGHICFIGESFFDFVKDCCLGRRILEEFPQLIKHMVPIDRKFDQVVKSTFTPG